MTDENKALTSTRCQKPNPQSQPRRHVVHATVLPNKKRKEMIKKEAINRFTYHYALQTSI